MPVTGKKRDRQQPSKGKKEGDSDEESVYGLTPAEKKRFLSMADNYSNLSKTMEEIKKSQAKAIATMTTIATKQEDLEKAVDKIMASDSDDDDDDDGAPSSTLQSQQQALQAALQRATASAQNPAAGAPAVGVGPEGSAPSSAAGFGGPLAPTPTIPATAPPIPTVHKAPPASAAWGPQLPTSAAATANAFPHTAQIPSAAGAYHLQVPPMISEQPAAQPLAYVSVRSISLDPTTWIAYVGTHATGAAMRLDLLIQELTRKFHVEQLNGMPKSASETALEAIRAFLTTVAATPNPTAFSPEALIMASRTLWYGSLVYTHGRETAEAWLARATDAPMAFSHFQAALDALPSNLKNPKKPYDNPNKPNGPRSGRFRGGRRWRQPWRRGAGAQNGNGNHGKDSKDKAKQQDGGGSHQGNGKKE